MAHWFVSSYTSGLQAAALVRYGFRVRQAALQQDGLAEADTTQAEANTEDITPTDCRRLDV